jgi:hypothetical protein
VLITGSLNVRKIEKISAPCGWIFSSLFALIHLRQKRPKSILL